MEGWERNECKTASSEKKKDQNDWNDAGPRQGFLNKKESGKRVTRNQKHQRGGGCGEKTESYERRQRKLR